MIDGRRVVLGVYAAVVAISAVVGGTVPLVLADIGQPLLFGTVSLPATVVGYAAYGGLTSAVLLGAGLVLLEAVSRRFAE